MPRLSRDTRRTSSTLGQLVMAGSGELRQIRVRPGADPREVRVVCEASDPAGSFARRIRLTRLTHPEVLADLLVRAARGPVGFQLRYAGRTRRATLTIAERGVTLDVEGLSALSFPGLDLGKPDVQAATGVDDLVVIAIVLVVMTVAAVGSLVVVTQSDSGSSEADGESSEDGRDDDGGGDGGADGGGGDGGGGDGGADGGAGS